MKPKLFTLFLLMSAFVKLSAHSYQIEQSVANLNRQFFIENKGQWPDEVLYLSQSCGVDIWITKSGVNYTFYKRQKDDSIPICNMGYLSSDRFDLRPEDVSLLGHRVIAKYLGANTNPSCQGMEKLKGYYNYLIGSDSRKHTSFVGLYKEAVVKNVYDGIDIRYYFDHGRIRYDYVIQPGGDPTQIQFNLCGQLDANLNDKDISFTTRFGEVKISNLYTYQDGKSIPSYFIKQGNIWKIRVEDFDHSKQLIIDPLIYSTYVGGSGLDYGNSIAIDGSGNAYITGKTESINYDSTPGSFQTTSSGNSDAFVTKLNSTGSGLIYSTYLGGSFSDVSSSIAVDNNQNSYITGITSSTNFATTVGAFQSLQSGASDVFISKLNATGSGLIYSTYLGGASNEQGYFITVDGSGNAYVVGNTESNNFDITAGAIQSTLSGSSDAFVTKLNSNGNALIFSTYLGGNDNDRALSLAVDANSNAYVTGSTSSTNFNTTAGAFQSTYGGGTIDVFVTKLNSTGSGIIYSTFLGGSSGDFGWSIAADNSGNAYVVGYTESSNFNTTAGAFQTTYGGGPRDAFITKLNSSGSALVYSTLLGGSNEDVGRFMNLDGNGNVYLTGNTLSTDFDITPNAIQAMNDGNWDVFVTKLNSAGNALIYSDYLGGSSYDFGVSMAIDGIGNMFLTGITNSTNFDLTPGSFQITNGGVDDVFITKLIASTPTSNSELMSDKDNFDLFPNPNSGVFVVQTENGGIFELIDMTGRLLSTYLVEKSNYVIQDKLPSGVYLFRERKSGRSLKLMVN